MTDPVKMYLRFNHKNVDGLKDEYQAGVFNDPNSFKPFDYHAVGETPQEALMRLALFWADRDGMDIEELIKKAIVNEPA